MILSSRSCSKAAAHPPVWRGQMEIVILSYCVWNLSWLWSSGVTLKFYGIVHGQLQTWAKELLCAEWLLSASVSPGLLPTWVSLQQFWNVPQLHSPPWVFALCYGHKWFLRMFPLSLPSAALDIAAKISLSFLPFWDDLGVPYPKEPWHKPSTVTACSEAALSGVKDPITQPCWFTALLLCQGSRQKYCSNKR